MLTWLAGRNNTPTNSPTTINPTPPHPPPTQHNPTLSMPHLRGMPQSADPAEQPLQQPTATRRCESRTAGGTAAVPWRGYFRLALALSNSQLPSPESGHTEAPSTFEWRVSPKKSLKWAIWGSILRAMKVDTRSVDYSSYNMLQDHHSYITVKQQWNYESRSVHSFIAWAKASKSW